MADQKMEQSDLKALEALNQAYGRMTGELAKAIVGQSAVIEEILTEQRGAAVRVHMPQRGDKTRLVEIASNAAKSRFAVDHGEEERIQRALDGIAEQSDPESPPLPTLSDGQASEDRHRHGVRHVAPDAPGRLAQRQRARGEAVIANHRPRD